MALSRSRLAAICAGLFALFLLRPEAGHAAASEVEGNTHSLEFVTEEFPPLNYNNNGNAEGYSAELVRAILEREKLPAKITVLPWPRAYKMAQAQANIGIFGLARTPQREKLFQWIGPIGNLDSKAIVKRDSPLHLNSLADAKDAKHVIVAREGYHAQTLQKLGFNNLVLVNSPIEGLRLLMVSDDRSVLVIPSNALPEALRRTGTPGDAVKPALNVMKVQVYIGFSLDTSASLINHMQHTLDAMKADGSFATLYEKWFPGEKPPGVEPEPTYIP